jgi:ankyrin repeat protein
MLESLKKEAKRWVKALRANDAPARARFVRVHPHPPESPTLRDVQLALARERGFAGWAELKAEIEAQPPRDLAQAKRIQWFLENACPDHHVRGWAAHARAESTAMRLLARYPDIAHDSFCTEVVCGNGREIEGVLAKRPRAASALCDTPDLQREEAAGDDWLKDLGAKGWQPLMYLCSTRLSKRSLYDAAVFRGEAEIVRLFERYGAPAGSTTVDGIQAFVIACRRHDASILRALAAEHPEYLRQSEAMFEAARRNDIAAMNLLLDLGVSADVEAADHTRALHIAGRSDSLEAAELLVAKGAEIDPVETTWQGTPIGTATYSGCQRVIDFLSRYSRDIGTITFNGKLERVRELVEADPSLARTTADGDSLLFWLPRDDEARAVAIARLLLEHGADPAVTDANGMMPSDRAERLAMFELALVLARR